MPPPEDVPLFGGPAWRDWLGPGFRSM
jgi:hypothetical protein